MERGNDEESTLFLTGEVTEFLATFEKSYVELARRKNVFVPFIFAHTQSKSCCPKVAKSSFQVSRSPFRTRKSSNEIKDDEGKDSGDLKSRDTLKNGPLD